MSREHSYSHQAEVISSLQMYIDIFHSQDLLQMHLCQYLNIRSLLEPTLYDHLSNYFPGYRLLLFQILPIRPFGTQIPIIWVYGCIHSGSMAIAVLRLILKLGWIHGILNCLPRPPLGLQDFASLGTSFP